MVGVSGGRDSTYVLYNALKLGLRPLAVHFDNGWNSEIAVGQHQEGHDEAERGPAHGRSRLGRVQGPAEVLPPRVRIGRGDPHGLRHPVGALQGGGPRGHPLHPERPLVPHRGHRPARLDVHGRPLRAQRAQEVRPHAHTEFPDHVHGRPDLLHVRPADHLRQHAQVHRVRPEEGRRDHEPGAGLAVLRRPPPRERVHPLLPVLPAAEEVRHRQAEDRVLGAHPLRADGPGKRRWPK